MICGTDVTIENVNRVLRFFNVFIPRGRGGHSQTQQRHGIRGSPISHSPKLKYKGFIILHTALI